MSSRFVKSLFISAVVALPLPLILPFALSAVIEGSAFNGILGQPDATSYYLVTWVLASLAGLVATLIVGAGQSESGQRSKAKRTAGKKASAAHSPDDSSPEGKDQGLVKWFNVNKGFGFITTDDGDDIFVHFRSIRGSGRRSLRQGQKVRFDVSEGDKGLQADNVSVISE